MSDMDQAFKEPLAGPVVSEEEVNRRKHLQAAFRLCLAGAAGQEVLVELGRICHFYAPAYTPEDMALQNAFKTILHRLGAWADDEQGERDIIRRLLEVV